MKYFNKYNTQRILNEKTNRDSDGNILSVLSVLKPLFSLLGRSVSRKRLRSIARGYDSYLTVVYKHYLSVEKLDIPQDDVDEFVYKDLDDTITSKPINKDNETEILIDKEKEILQI